MLKDIISMQEDKDKIEEIINKYKEKAKRTTIILEKDERNFIDSLIQDGKEPGIKPLISKMLNIYRSMMIYDWRFPGEYYFGISRIVFVNVELIHVLVQYIQKEKQREVGRKMGEATQVSIETTFNINVANHNNWHKVFQRLRVQGFGEFYLKDKYILIRTPFISEAEVWAGFLEGLFDIKLNVKTSIPPYIFEIKGESNYSKNKLNT